MNYSRYTLTFLLLLSALGTSHSQTPTKPMVQTEVLADRFRGENDGETAYLLFEDNVVLTATNMTLKCQKLEIYTLLKNEESDQPQGKVAIGVFSSIEKILASGGVEIIQHERYATAERAEVQPNEERVVLSGSPIVEQGGWRFSNPKGELILDRGSGRISAPGEENVQIQILGPPIGDLGFELDENTKESAAEESEKTADSTDESESKNDTEN